MNPPAPSITLSARPLPPGTRLTDFEVREVLGVGGFGIVYRAFDHTLERDVALKEYMPSALADRTATLHVSLRSSANEETFKLGLRSFVNEARLLARFDHPSLVKVYRFWEANGTAYMVMPLYRGRTLKALVADGAGPRDEVALRRILLPLLGALERLHDDGVFHRDISPDNILIEPDGHPVLLDFGAARHVIADRSQNLTAILKPSYAPIEQYAEDGGVKQGPWTDFYALGATLHFLIAGKAPPPATARTIDDFMVPLAEQAPAGCSTTFLQILDWMLAPRPNDRPRSVAALRDALGGHTTAPISAGAARRPAFDEDATVVLAPREDLLAATVMLPRGTNAPAPAARGPTTVPPRQPTLRPVPAPATPANTQTIRAQTLHQPREPARAGAPVQREPARRSPWTLMAAVAGYGAIGVGALWWFFGTRGPTLTTPAVIPPATPVAAASAPLGAAPAASAPLLVAAAASAAASAAAIVAAPSPAPSDQTPASAPTTLAAAMTGATTAPAAAITASAPQRRLPQVRPAAATPLPPPPIAEYTPPLPAPVVVARAAPRPASAPAPAPAAPVVSNPREACRGRVLVAYWNCVSRECVKPELAPHPECVRWREMQARQRNSETQ